MQTSGHALDHLHGYTNGPLAMAIQCRPFNIRIGYTVGESVVLTGRPVCFAKTGLIGESSSIDYVGLMAIQLFPQTWLQTIVQLKNDV